jgi:hypothetical protein
LKFLTPALVFCATAGGAGAVFNSLAGRLTPCFLAANALVGREAILNNMKNEMNETISYGRNLFYETY